MINFDLENILIIIILLSFLSLLFRVMLRTKKNILKFTIILSLCLFFVLFCIRDKGESRYELTGTGTTYEINTNNKISSIGIYYDANLKISLAKTLRSLYSLKNIKIIYQNKEIGIIEINKNIDELDCDNETNSCEYSIKEPLEDILKKENLQSKLTSDTFIYGINYFKFKVSIESQKKNQKTEFIIDQVGIRYIKSGLELNWIPM